MQKELKKRLLESGYVIDNEYLDKYVHLIAEHINDEKIIKKTHSHHILPVSYFTSRGIEVDNSANNRVNLSYKNHMIAHLYLSGCTQGQNRYKNLYSLLMMSHFDKEGYLDITNYDKYDDLYSDAISSAPNHRKGTKCSEETKQRMKLASRRKIEKYGSAYNKGSIWVHKGDEERMVFEQDLNKYLEEGYERGRSYRHDIQTLNKIAESSRNKVITDEFREKMREIGRLSNVDRDPESYKRQGRFMHEYYKTHVNPFKGKHHTEESLKKNRDAHLGRKRIVKDGAMKIVRPEEMEQFIADGWVEYVSKVYQNKTDKIFVTNGIINKLIHLSELQYWESQGFRRGCKQNHNKTKNNT